jgi:hypothetical protein
MSRGGGLPDRFPLVFGGFSFPFLYYLVNCINKLGRLGLGISKVQCLKEEWGGELHECDNFGVACFSRERSCNAIVGGHGACNFRGTWVVGNSFFDVFERGNVWELNFFGQIGSMGNSNRCGGWEPIRGPPIAKTEHQMIFPLGVALRAALDGVQDNQLPTRCA